MKAIPYGWVSGSGTFTFAQSVTGAGYSSIPVAVEVSGGRLTIACALEDDLDDGEGAS